jgi:hypothetical protein
VEEAHPPPKHAVVGAVLVIVTGGTLGVMLQVWVLLPPPTLVAVSVKVVVTGVAVVLGATAGIAVWAAVGVHVIVVPLNAAFAGDVVSLSVTAVFAVVAILL